MSDALLFYFSAMEKTDSKSALAERVIPVLQVAMSSPLFQLKQVLLSSILEICSVSGGKNKVQSEFPWLTPIPISSGLVR